MAVHTEKQLESAIEAELLAEGGWESGRSDQYSRELGLAPQGVLAFIRETQPATWKRLVSKYGSEATAEQGFLRRLSSELTARGSLTVLRHGVTDRGERLALCYFRPQSGADSKLVEKYAANRMTLIRQLRYSGASDDELDLAFFVNGIPTHDAELKNSLTGQTVEDAIKQYRTSRDPREVWFKSRSLAHFAVDTDLAYVATSLRGSETTFLPFNLGHEGGEGNPPNPNGYATDYLWTRVWQRDAWLEILEKFLFADKTEIAGEERKEIIFPRYHQWDGVRALLQHARNTGPGHRYLIQHSAGSGKSKTIAWLAHSLMNLHDASGSPVFDKVVVVTDRRALDSQLRDQVLAFEQVKGVVKIAKNNSKQLEQGLHSAEARIITTTLQKFPFVIETAADVSNKSYAVLIDEAHSSQTGETAAKLKLVLGKGMDESELLRQAEEIDERSSVDDEDEVVRMVRARGQQPNISFFAFTATPKHKTLVLFGEKGDDGLYRPFHLYTMRQAIDEGFIIDVLANFVSYKTYYKVAQRSETEDPELAKREAVKAIARYVSLHERQFELKAEVVAEHFRQRTAHKINGQAKAMWVTRSRLHAVRSYQALSRYLQRRGYPIGVLVAFSGTVTDPVTGEEYTERSMNDFPETETPDRFRTDKYRILVVAEKYQTGYDEPLLHTMFVDKKLEDVKAVQTLSRLNRWWKGKGDTFVLDFENPPDRIQEAFKPFYNGTITEADDPNILYNALDAVEAFGILREEEIQRVATVLAKRSPTSADHTRLYGLLEPARNRFTEELSSESQEDFRTKATHYVRLYSFIGQILPYTDARAETYYAYLRLLLRRLPGREEHGLDLGDKLFLSAMRVDQAGKHNLSLDQGQEELPGFGGTGDGSAPREDEKNRLSELIQLINERFGTNLGPADQLVFEQIAHHMASDDELIETAKANTEDNFRFGFDRKFEPLVLDRYEASDALFARILADKEFGEIVRRAMAAEVYERARQQGVG